MWIEMKLKMCFVPPFNLLWGFFNTFFHVKKIKGLFVNSVGDSDISSFSAHMSGPTTPPTGPACTVCPVCVRAQWPCALWLEAMTLKSLGECLGVPSSSHPPALPLFQTL